MTDNNNDSAAQTTVIAVTKTQDIQVGEETPIEDDYKGVGLSSPTDDVPKDCPKSFLCPITMEVMKNPVMDCEGNTYESKAIVEWIEKHSTSPITKRPLQKKQLVPNRALREMIYRYMGPEWSKEAEKSIEEVPVEFNPLRRGSFVGAGGSNNTATMTTTTNTTNTSRDYRGIVDGFLEDISRAVGKNIRLNRQGICAFTYEHMTIVVEVPRSVGSFFIYCAVYHIQQHNPIPLVDIYQKALRLNYLQQETRGGCLSLDPFNMEILVSYTDRIDEITSTDFRNVLENFIDKGLELCKEF